jgi:hypothetical protein
MTTSKTDAINPEAAGLLARWAGLAVRPGAEPELAAVFRAFGERVQRLEAIDVEAVEFDFLRPMD